MSAAGWTAAHDAATPFNENVKVSITGETLVVKSDGIPNHPTAVFPNSTNPNKIMKQDYTFYLPRSPRVAPHPTRLPMGPIGVALNGIPFYNPFNAEGNDAVSGLYEEVFDSCCGHPDQMGRYHYHKYPVCIKTPFKDTLGKHSPLLGYAFDGFGIYGPQSDGGKPPTDLDACNGHTDSIRGYHYHVTDHFPYILGGYKGTPDKRNFDNQAMHRVRPGARMFYPPPPPPPPPDGGPPPPPF